MPTPSQRQARRCVALAALGLLLAAGSARAGPLPAQVDLRPNFERWGLTVKAQGKRDTCSLFALVGVLEYEYAARGARGLRLSEDFLNWASHQVSGRRTDGSFFAQGVRGLRRHGVCRAELMPNAARFDPRARPSARARADGRTRTAVRADWIKAWDVRTGLSAGQLRAIKQRLAAGHPVAVGFRWPRREAWGPGHTMRVPPARGVYDGHSVILVGYRDDRSQPGGGVFLLRNSWGPGWQEGGYARMPYAYAAAYGNDALSLRVGRRAGG